MKEAHGASPGKPGPCAWCRPPLWPRPDPRFLVLSTPQRGPTTFSYCKNKRVKEDFLGVFKKELVELVRSNQRPPSHRECGGQAHPGFDQCPSALMGRPRLLSSRGLWKRHSFRSLKESSFPPCESRPTSKASPTPALMHSTPPPVGAEADCANRSRPVLLPCAGRDSSALSFPQGDGPQLVEVASQVGRVAGVARVPLVTSSGPSRAPRG